MKARKLFLGLTVILLTLLVMGYQNCGTNALPKSEAKQGDKNSKEKDDKAKGKSEQSRKADNKQDGKVDQAEGSVTQPQGTKSGNLGTGIEVGEEKDQSGTTITNLETGETSKGASTLSSGASDLSQVAGGKFPVHFNDLVPLLPRHRDDINPPKLDAGSYFDNGIAYSEADIFFTFPDRCADGKDCHGQVYIYDFIDKTDKVLAHPEYGQYWKPAENVTAGNGSVANINHNGYDVRQRISVNVPNKKDFVVVSTTLFDRFLVVVEVDSNEPAKALDILDSTRLDLLDGMKDKVGPEPAEIKDGKLIYLDLYNTPTTYIPLQVFFGACELMENGLDSTPVSSCYEYWDILEQTSQSLQEQCRAARGRWVWTQCSAEQRKQPSCQYDSGARDGMSNVLKFSANVTQDKCVDGQGRHDSLFTPAQ